MWLYHRLMSPNDAEGMANSVDPDQTAPLIAVWSGSALFAQAYLSENLGSLRWSRMHWVLRMHSWWILPHHHHHHHHHIHFRALFSSTEGWAFWQVFLEGILSTQNGSEGQQNPYLASFCHSPALHPMISLACQIFSVQPHSACVLQQSSLCLNPENMPDTDEDDVWPQQMWQRQKNPQN